MGFSFPFYKASNMIISKHLQPTHEMIRKKINNKKTTYEQVN